MQTLSGTTEVRRDTGEAEHGFTLIELLVTVLLAGIIFCAMAPVFVTVLKGSSTTNRRVIATNLAQARLEAVHMLAFSDITQANLNSSTFAAGQFNPSFTPAKGGRPYSITTTVTTPTPTANPPYKTITVAVSNPVDNFSTTVTNVVMNPAAVTSTAGTGTGGIGPYSITVAFKSAAEVTSPGVYVTRYALNTSASPTPIPTATVIISPTQMPSPQPSPAATTTVSWSNLTGGPGYLYTVTVNCGNAVTPIETSSAFHLLSNWWMKFDTNPGGS